MQVKNKWNGKVYTVLEKQDKIVILQRPDNTVFSIAKSEYNYNYFELDK